MSQISQTKSAAVSLERLVESVEAIVGNRMGGTKEEKDTAPHLHQFLSQLSAPDVKAVYFIIQAGRNSSWLEESSSIPSLYENLCGIRPASEGKQSCIDFLLPKIDHIQTYITRYFYVCNRLGIDPLTDLEYLTHIEKAQSQ